MEKRVKIFAKGSHDSGRGPDNSPDPDAAWNHCCSSTEETPGERKHRIWALARGVGASLNLTKLSGNKRNGLRPGKHRCTKILCDFPNSVCPFSKPIFGFHVIFDEGCTIRALNMCMHSYNLSDRCSFLTRRAPQRRWHVMLWPKVFGSLWFLGVISVIFVQPICPFCFMMLMYGMLLITFARDCFFGGARSGIVRFSPHWGPCPPNSSWWRPILAMSRGFLHHFLGKLMKTSSSSCKWL